MRNPKNEANAEKNGLKSAIHGLFAKIQSKTGLEDKKIDEFQEKWLAIPENRTKYKHLEDAPAIMGEELFAMFNDIIDFMQAEEAGKSHVFESLRIEALAIRENPKGYLGQKVDSGKGLWQKGINYAKRLIGKREECKMEMRMEIEDIEDEDMADEEMSEFEKAEMEDEMGPVKTQPIASPSKKPISRKPVTKAKPKKTARKGKGN